MMVHKLIQSLHLKLITPNCTNSRIMEFYEKVYDIVIEIKSI